MPLTVADSVPLADTNNPPHAEGGFAAPLRIAITGSVLCIVALILYLTAPPKMVTSVILNEKPAMISSADGLTGSLLNEPGEKELFLVLEFTEKDETKEHQTLTIELAQIGNGVAFDVPDDLIQYRQLRRITAREEDIYFHDTYDTIDVTLGEPFIGTAYQFHVNRTHPRQRTIIAILGVGIALLILGIIRYFRLIAR